MAKATKQIIEIRRAQRKHLKELARKGRKFVSVFPLNYNSANITDAQKTLLVAPKDLRILTNRSEVIEYFNSIRSHVDSKVYTLMDMTQIKHIDLATISLLISIMMDERSQGDTLRTYLTVRTPVKGTVVSEMFEKAKFLQTVTKNGIADHGYFMSRLDTEQNEQYNLDILKQAETFFGSRLGLTTLHPVLTEIFANTNNHADPTKEEDEANKIPWFISLLEMPDENKMYFCVIDLGVGIHDSLNLKGKRMVSEGTLSVEQLKTVFSTSQSTMLRTHIPKGINSSTGIAGRGQGLKEVYDRAQEGPYSRFEILTNKAWVNIIDNTEVSKDSEYNLEGTICYWEMEIERI